MDKEFKERDTSSCNEHQHRDYRAEPFRQCYNLDFPFLCFYPLGWIGLISESVKNDAKDEHIQGDADYATDN